MMHFSVIHPDIPGMQRRVYGGICRVPSEFFKGPPYTLCFSKKLQYIHSFQGMPSAQRPSAFFYDYTAVQYHMGKLTTFINYGLLHFGAYFPTNHINLLESIYSYTCLQQRILKYQRQNLQILKLFCYLHALFNLLAFSNFFFYIRENALQYQRQNLQIDTYLVHPSLVLVNEYLHAFNKLLVSVYFYTLFQEKCPKISMIISSNTIQFILQQFWITNTCMPLLIYYLRRISTHYLSESALKYQRQNPKILRKLNYQFILRQFCIKNTFMPLLIYQRLCFFFTLFQESCTKILTRSSSNHTFNLVMKLYYENRKAVVSFLEIAVFPSNCNNILKNNSI